jgi:CheY-like chemotaxis protein
MKFDFLLIDDDPIFNFLNEKIVSETGCAQSLQIFIAAEEGFAYLQDLNAKGLPLPGIILLDLRMPSMNGIEFLELFHQFPEDRIKHTGIYMLSSSLNEADRMKTLSFPRVKDFLSKPLTIEQLQELCKNISEEK